MKSYRWIVCVLVAVLSPCGSLLASSDSVEDRPGRGLTAAFQFPGVTFEPEDAVSIDLLIRNRGQRDETVLIEVTEQPPGWEVQLKKFSAVVGGVFVPAGGEQTLTFSAKPVAAEPAARPATPRLPAGTHRFSIRARSEDGTLTQSSSVAVTVKEKPRGVERISLDTTYPELRGPSDDKFVFSLEVRNDTEQDGIFNFRATAPPGWGTSFKPAYEQKQIASLQINANSNKTVEFEVTPPYNAMAGDYDFRVETTSPKGRAEKDLRVTITGTHAIKAGTPSGLLSLVTERGRKATVSIMVENRGSAPQGEVRLQAFKPENWQVTFEPESIRELEPGDFRQVEMSITPAAESLVGDYAINVNAQGEKAGSDVEFRITIKAATTWGWVGVGIIVLVIGGLAVIFKTLGRR